MWDQGHFDAWAGEYDESIAQSERGYPFEGYYDVLSYVRSLIPEPEKAAVLDIGMGTGLLTHELYKLGARITGIDFSENMLEKARGKMPEAVLYRHDFSRGMPDELAGARFDYIVSSYALHHLSDSDKVRLLCELERYIAKPGMVIIADVAFATKAERETCRSQAGGEWDEEEYYLAADEFIPLLDEMKASFVSISPCAGVLRIIYD